VNVNAARAGHVDLAPYLARVGYHGPLDASVDTLRALHLAHVSHIPFENVDVLLGRGVDLDPAALERKLVAESRGGYCFEHNLLFSGVLETLGFELTRLSARVRFGAAGGVRPRTHMLLLVTVAGSQWIADVGFGSDGLVLPVPFSPQSESPQGLRTYRVVQEGGWWVMQAKRDAEWVDLYVFSLDAHERIDYEVLNHYTATHPRSIFRSLLLAQLSSLERRLMLRNRQLTIETAAGTTTRTLSEQDVVAALRDTFGLQLPPGTTLQVPE
jgi:N-hydroxyarylamine O-acetyltransferase